ncbi:MAG TPA: hypothetical protein VGR13_03585 [Actinomycetota bacterium]|nr:hypothetical protein [Actinomycetota bacterium]
MIGVQAAADSGRSRSSPGPGGVLVPLGISLTLIGVIGDLLAHTLNPQGHAQENLIVLGSGNNPWHLVLFAGILIAATGGIRWAGRLSSEIGAPVGAAIVLLLIATVGIGGYSGWQAAHESASTGHIDLVGGPQIGSAPRDDVTHSHAGQAPVGEGPEGASNFGGHSHGPAGPTTEQQWLMLGRQLAAAKASTAKYRSLERARADGYFQVTQFIPGLGLHMANLGIRQDVFDPTRPQLLLYTPRRSGGYRLAGVGYAFIHDSDIPPAGFAGGEDVWHFHTNLCFLLNGSVTVTPDGAACRSRGGVFQKETAWLLHAWIWKTNPRGVFTETNPTVF